MKDLKNLSRRVLVWGCFLALSLLAAERGRSLWASPGQPSAHEEHRWMAWAWCAPEAKPILRDIRKELRPGEKVVILLSPGKLPTAYAWKTYALYLWNQNTLVGVESSESHVPTADPVVRVCIAPSGEWILNRERVICP